MKRAIISSFLSLLCLSSYAEMNQTMSDQTDRSEFEKSLDNYYDGSSYVRGSTEEAIGETDEKSNYVPGAVTGTPEFNEDEKGHFVSGSVSSPEEYIEFSNKDIVGSIYHRANKAFSFSYLPDNYDVKDDKGTYSKIFEADSADSVKGGFLLLNWDYYLTRRLFSPFVGAGAGFGFSTGKGRFVNGEKSLAKFNLWMVPIDLHLGLEMGVSKYINLSLMGGPSGMGLWQDRNDREQGDPKKTRRQFGYGYFATAKLSFNLSQIFTNMGFEIYKVSDISNLGLDFIARTHNYSNFADNVELSGTSFGIGFSFEYL